MNRHSSAYLNSTVVTTEAPSMDPVENDNTDLNSTVVTTEDCVLRQEG